MGLLLGCIIGSADAADTPASPTSVETQSASSVEPASEIDAGIAAVENEDYDKAFSIFSRLANAGNAEAQHNLAMLYRAGKGVKKDLASSLKWFRRAAEQGIADAQYYLGYMYDNGEAVEKSAQYAFIWYRKAAEQGHGLAQINLGVLYVSGEPSVPQDVEQAYLWFHVAAAQGYKAAFENKMMIEAALKKQGQDGLAMLESLKKRARVYFQRYVQAFAQKPASPPNNRIPPSGH